jgi:hypothetical protein
MSDAERPREAAGERFHEEVTGCNLRMGRGEKHNPEGRQKKGIEGCQLRK